MAKYFKDRQVLRKWKPRKSVYYNPIIKKDVLFITQTLGLLQSTKFKDIFFF